MCTIMKFKLMCIDDIEDRQNSTDESIGNLEDSSTQNYCTCKVSDSTSNETILVNMIILSSKIKIF
jgi:hypothetical protein